MYRHQMNNWLYTPFQHFSYFWNVLGTVSLSDKRQPSVLKNAYSVPVSPSGWESESPPWTVPQKTAQPPGARRARKEASTHLNPPPLPFLQLGNFLSESTGHPNPHTRSASAAGGGAGLCTSKQAQLGTQDAGTCRSPRKPLPEQPHRLPSILTGPGAAREAREPATGGHRPSARPCPAAGAARPPAAAGEPQLSPSLEPAPRLGPRSAPDRPSSPFPASAGGAPDARPYLRLPPGPPSPPPQRRFSPFGRRKPASGRRAAGLRRRAVAAGSGAAYMIDAGSRFPPRPRPLSLLPSNPQLPRPPAPPPPPRLRDAGISCSGGGSPAQIESNGRLSEEQAASAFLETAGATAHVSIRRAG